MTKSTADLIDGAARYIAEKIVSDEKLTAGERFKGFASLIDYLKIATGKDDGESAPKIEAFDAVRDRIRALTHGNGNEPAN